MNRPVRIAQPTGALALTILAMTNLGAGDVVHFDRLPRCSGQCGGSNPSCLLDLDNNGTPDFCYRYPCCDCPSGCTSTLSGTLYVPIVNGEEIGPSLNWENSVTWHHDAGGCSSGPGCDTPGIPAFIGLRFDDNKGTHYGWLRVVSGSFIDYAYQTDAGTAILAGDGLPTLADINGNGTVDVADLLAAIGSFGPCPSWPSPCAADLNNDRVVNLEDVLILIAHWDCGPVIPYFVQNPVSAIVAGGDAKFSALTNIPSMLTYQWRKDGVNLDDGGNIFGATTSTLTISPASDWDIGSYSLMASTSRCSVVSHSGNLVVNNNCANAPVVYVGTRPFTTIGATTDGPDEPLGCNFGGYTQIGNDAWFRFNAPCTGSVTVSLCGTQFDAKLAVYSGCPIESGQAIACNDNWCGLAPEVTIGATSGTTYWIRIGGVNGATGVGTMAISCVSITPPLNDNCTNAAVTSAGNHAFSTLSATTDGPDEPSACEADAKEIAAQSTLIQNDVWFKYGVPSSGTVTISLCGSTFDSAMAVYHACPSGPGQTIACNDDFCGNASQVTVPVAGSTVLRIRIGSLNGATGIGTMFISFTPE